MIYNIWLDNFHLPVVKKLNWKYGDIIQFPPYFPGKYFFSFCISNTGNDLFSFSWPQLCEPNEILELSKMKNI